MINVYAATANDYSTNGLLVLDPWCTSARIREKLNGEYTLTLELEINARTVEVVNEMVIKVPAPVRFTPQLDIFTPSANEIWKVNTNTKRLSLRTKPSTTSGRVLHAYKKGTEVVVTDKSNPQWYVVAAPDGRSGYMEVRWLAYVRDEFEAPAVSGVIEEHKTKEQLFRVRSVSSTLDRITIEAQHISYDLRRNYIKSASTKGMRGAEAFPAMMAATISGHEFNAYSDIAETVTEDIKRKNPIEALFSDGGLISTAGGEVLRDNFDIYWVQHIGQDRGVSIAYRKNMSGMDVKIDTNGLVTRIIPVGYNKNNEPIYGDPVDSAHINEYAQPYILEYEYKDIKVGNGYKDAAAVRAEVQRLAALEYDKGIDLPTVSASVGYVDLQNTDVGKTLQAFTGVFLADTVRIRHEDYRFDIATQINAYEWDVLLNEYVGIDLGSKQASMSDVRISPSQIGNSTLAGRKLAVGTISGAELGEGSVSSEHITDDAVENRHISANSIEADQIAAKSITAEKIAADAITSDKIAAGAIEAGKIAAGAITAEKIGAKAITTRHIEAGTVTAESGIIANGAIGTAQIADGSITSAKVVELNADVIKTGTLSAERLLLVGDDGVIYKINAASSGLSLTELSKDQYKHYINGTVIVAKSITAAQIAARTITSNEILAGTITAKEINVSDLFASQATINALNAMDISGNKYLRLMVSDAANSVRVGGTQLIPESRSFGSGWKFWNASSYGYGSGAWPGYNRTRQNMSGITNEWQSCITTPLMPLPEDWDGRQVTLSAYLSATLWSAVDNGITWTLCLSDGSTERGYYFNKYNVVVPGTAQWGSDMRYDRQPAAGKFVRAWTTYDMAEANFTAITEDYSYADCTHMFVQFWLRQNGDLRMVAPKLEWGNRATDWSYAPDDIDTDIAGLQSQIDLLPGAIELAVKEVQVGGTNLLMRTRDLTTDDSRTDCWWLGSGRTRSEGDGDAAQIDWRITGDTANNWRAVKSPIFRLPDGWQGNKAAVSLWVYSDNWAAMDYGMCWRLFLTAGDRSESYRYAQAQILDAGGAAGADMQGSTPANGKWKRIWAVFELSEAGFTNGSGSLSGATHAWIGYYCVKNVTMSMKKPQLEIGNKPTAWSPNPEEFHAGSAVTITRDEVKISTPEFNVDIVGADGETNMLSIDENGAQMRSLTAPDVAPRYAGPATLYVNPAATSAQIAAGNYYRSLADALAALSNRWISSNVVINLAAGMTEYGRCELGGTAGHGIIYIRGDASKRAKLVGSMAIHYNGCPVMITNMNIDTGSGGSAIDCAGAQTFVIAENCILTGAGTSQSVNGMWSRQGAKVDIHTCEIYDFNAAVKVEQTGVAQVYGCKGNCYVRINMGTIYATGSMPSGGTAWDAEVWGGALHTSGITVNQGSKPTPTPAPTTSTVTANATRSYTNAWRQSDTEIRQGYYSGMGEWAGCMWFPTASFSGKTIKKASLTLTRISGSGKGSAVSLKLYGIKIASASGNPLTNAVDYGVIGTIENGKTKTFTLPTTAGQALANGTIKGFMLYAGDGKTLSGKDYSTNYCKISSSGDTVPELTMTY